MKNPDREGRLPYVINCAWHRILFSRIMVVIGRIIKIVDLGFMFLIWRAIINIVLETCIGTLKNIGQFEDERWFCEFDHIVIVFYLSLLYPFLSTLLGILPLFYYKFSTSQFLLPQYTYCYGIHAFLFLRISFLYTGYKLVNWGGFTWFCIDFIF